MNGVSIIICCYNSAPRLEETLRHLANQQIKKDIHCEIIVVDNNSTDNTAVEAQRIWNSFNNAIPFKVVTEPQPGLSFARKKGVHTAEFEYIIFCDDDNWLDKNYVQIVYDFFELNGAYAAIGGKIEATFENGFIVPDWFEEYKEGYAIGQQGKDGDVTYRGLIWGAGIGFRKSVYTTIINDSFPSLLSDRKGNELSSGGDSEMCLRFIIVGYKLYYTSELKLKHFLTANRLTIPYRTKLWQGFDEAGKIISKYYQFIFITGTGYHKRKAKAVIKYWLSVVGIRKLSATDKNLLYILTNVKVAGYDPDFKLMRDLKR